MPGINIYIKKKKLSKEEIEARVKLWRKSLKGNKKENTSTS